MPGFERKCSSKRAGYIFPLLVALVLLVLGEGIGAKAQAAPAFADPYQFALQKLPSGAFHMQGHVPNKALGMVVAQRTGQKLVDMSEMALGAPDRFSLNVFYGLDALSALQSGELDFDGVTWSLQGLAASNGVRQELLARLNDVLDSAASWQIDIILPDTPARSVMPPKTRDNIAPDPLAWCRAEIASLFGARTILFDSGSDHIAAASAMDIERLASVLERCPKAYVYIEGHTDSDGDEQSNLALSLARAEAVTDRLAEFGVDPTRLYAVGYGESLPIADNDTRAGKQRNRRIVIVISNERR